MNLTFGTDGIRALYPEELNYQTSYAIGRAIFSSLKPQSVVIGQDTRISSDEIASGIIKALKEGLTDVTYLGVIPTPAVAYLSRRQKSFGVVVSASHNPYQYNGIKVFNLDGKKLEESKEREIEKLINQFLSQSNDKYEFNQHNLTTVDLSQIYLDFIKTQIKSDKIKKKVVLDCANGSAYKIAPGLFESIGLEVITIANEPDGKNINDNCGATATSNLSEMVKRVKADFGLAFDGDADRLIAIDENGAIVDGDHIIALFALDLKKRGLLKNNKVVVTIMTNMAFHLTMRKAGIEVITVNVGDKYVASAMEKEGAILGGESSGHIIRSDLHVTGDGILTAVLLLELLNEYKLPLSVITKSLFEKMPQIITNITWNYSEDRLLEESKDVVRLAEKTLNGKGRIIVRKSGTEPVARIMVEAPKESLAKELAELIGSTLSNL